MLDKTLNIRGTLTSLATPLVMGILNITPDSFYAGSRKQTETAIEDRIREILSEGGDWIDIGGYSSRPDTAEVTPEEEMRRLEFALHILNKHYPYIPVSVDTFRAGIARRCVEEYGAAIINDISGVFVIDMAHSFKVGVKIKKFASDHKLIVRIEELKLEAKLRADEFKKRHSFLFPLSGRIDLNSELSNYESKKVSKSAENSKEAEENL